MIGSPMLHYILPYSYHCSVTQCRHLAMKRCEKPLSETNPYRRDPKLRDKMTVVAAASSAAIEGIHVPHRLIAKALRPGWKSRRSSRRHPRK